MSCWFKRMLAITLAAVLLISAAPTISFAAQKNAEVTPATIGTIDAIDDGDTNYRFIEPVKHQKTVPEGYTGIYTPEDLNRVRDNLTGNYILMNDIDMSDWGGWEPIGQDEFVSIRIESEEEFNAAKQLYHILYNVYQDRVDNYDPTQHTYYYFSRFRGNFDGNGYEIHNLMIHLQSSVNTGHCKTNAGLFGYTEDGVIKNLGVLGVDVNVLSTSPSGACVGSIIGQSESEIHNCYSTGSINTLIQNSKKGSSQVLQTGAILGKCSQKISQCYNLAEVHSFSEVSINVSVIDSGGIAGACSDIENCYNTGNIKSFNLGNGSQSPSAYCGGITASSLGNINNCNNKGNISAKATPATWSEAIAGGITAGSRSLINSCYNSGMISACSDSTIYTYPSCAGGISGRRGETMSGIANCYNIGTVKAVNTTYPEYAHAGGLIGYISGKTNHPIANSYNIGTVQSSNLIGALVGKTAVPTTIQNCFYNDLFNDPIGDGDNFTLNNVSYLEPEQFSHQSSFTGFDFANVWRMDPKLGRPVLRNSILPDTGEAEQPDPVPGDDTPLNLPVMDDTSAKSFLGFLFNDSSFLKKDISDEPYYQLLTGAYQNDLGKQLEFGNSFLAIISAQLSAHINSSAATQAYLRQSLIHYLKKQLDGMQEIPEQEYNEFLNTQLDHLKEGILDALIGFTEKTTGIVITQSVIDDINMVSSAYSKVMALPQKVEKFVDSSVAAVQAVFLPLQGELNGRYRYFNLYLQQRRSFEPDDEIFRFIMDYNSWALRQENGAGALINCLPNISSWTENIPTIESWAEYVYQLQIALTSQKQSSQFSEGNYKRISIQCPVDIFVSDASGAVVGIIKDDKVQSCTDDQIYLALLGESKLVCIPEDAGYQIKIVAREAGVLSYSCQSIDGNRRETERTNYYDIPLTAGQSFIARSKNHYAALELANEQGEPQETVPGQDTISTQAEKYKVLLSIRGAGTVTGSDLYTKGDYASLTATPEEGYSFDGWYLKGQKLSDEASGYGFTVKESLTIEARFVPIKISVTGITLSKTTLTMESESKTELQAIITPADATDQTVVWSSSDEFVVTVNQAGQLIAHKSGTAIITATSLDSNYTASCTVTVKDPIPPQVTITSNGKDAGDVLYVKLPSIWDAYKKHSVTLDYSLSNATDVQSVKWSYANWSVSNPEATIESPNSARTVIRPNGKGIGARSVWITVTITDTKGRTCQDTVKVRFYKFDWQK